MPVLLSPLPKAQRVTAKSRFRDILARDVSKTWSSELRPGCACEALPYYHIETKEEQTSAIGSEDLGQCNSRVDCKPHNGHGEDHKRQDSMMR